MPTKSFGRDLMASSSTASYWGTLATSDSSLLAQSFNGCSNQNSCCPSFCVKASNAACTLTGSNITEASMKQKVAAVASKTCTQSTDPRCTTAALTAVFGRYPAVKAAYCNADFIVIQSTDLPSHATSLDSVFTPPGGGEGGCACPF